ncbi:TetR/AcrR family transcriptional regulator [Arthrobacter woluwensis]|uniref:TetR/AcrR family transcriptional regulator n=1 Tax=Arthrobacter woluwensis TaxID=156980 RepID=UPI001AAEB907|nr:TetR/AcrR family transcriptional regulator [Arthrobacter woluwensis]QTF73433.1 TetR/AcrR family transcriptional regulator [Arthrobacter woluwensis]
MSPAEPATRPGLPPAIDNAGGPGQGPAVGDDDGAGRRRRPQRTSASRQKIFDASMQLIGERGAAEVTVDEIAAEAGVSKGTVYYNFGSKSELIAQLLRHGVDILLARFAAVPAVEDPVAAMESVVSEAIAFLDDYPSFGQLWMNENWKAENEWRDLMRELRSELLDVISQALDRIGQRYAVNQDVSRSGLEAAIFGACFIVGLDRKSFHPGRSQEASVEAIMTFVKGYLAR